MVFSIVVVAENPLYTTTTSGLYGSLRFIFGVRVRLQVGCGKLSKQFGGNNMVIAEKVACQQQQARLSRGEYSG
jgi:hypothetical protein